MHIYISLSLYIYIEREREISRHLALLRRDGLRPGAGGRRSESFSFLSLSL